jgi:hypothetical protein
MNQGQIAIPVRTRLRLSTSFDPTKPTSVEVDLAPTGAFGVQDGRTPVRAQPATMQWDQKTGDFKVLTSEGMLPELQAVSESEIALGLDRPVSVQGNRISWVHPPGSDAEAISETIAATVRVFLAQLPLLSFRFRRPLKVSTILLKQTDESRATTNVGWLEFLDVLITLYPYDHPRVVEQLHGFEAWLSSLRLDARRWWAVGYFVKALELRSTSSLVDEFFPEIIMNLYKSAESLLGARQERDVRKRAEGLAVTDLASELEWLYKVRGEDDVVHSIVLQGQSSERLRKVYADRPETLGRAFNVVQALIDKLLDKPQVINRGGSG